MDIEIPEVDIIGISAIELPAQAAFKFVVSQFDCNPSKIKSLQNELESIKNRGEVLKVDAENLKKESVNFGEEIKVKKTLIDTLKAQLAEKGATVYDKSKGYYVHDDSSSISISKVVPSTSLYDSSSTTSKVVPSTSYINEDTKINEDNEEKNEIIIYTVIAVIAVIATIFVSKYFSSKKSR